jgi:trehalose 6-phosphate phosphatase
MQYFLERSFIRNLREEVKKAQRIFLFLDYDGTLTSIRKAPGLALLSSSVRKVLQRLSGLPQVTLAIISGRSLNEITKQVNLNNINYVGNHGLEMKVGSHQEKTPTGQKIRKKIASFCQKIKRRTQRFSGVMVENKGLTASIHYRLAKKDCVPELKRIVSSVLLPCKGAYELREGKKVLEIRPKVKRNKGWAVNKIIHLYSFKNKLSSLYLYFGDDSTDEDAFQLANSKRGYSILVDKNKHCSKAHYYLKGPKEVHLFLTWLSKRLIQQGRR